MLSTKRRIAALAMAGIGSLFSLAGCGAETKIAAPVISNVGNTISWKAVDEAVSYEIYRNDTLLETIDNLYYIVKENDSVAEFSVAARKDEEHVSELSEPVVIYKVSGFTEAETMNIDLTNDGLREYSVASTINYVHITGTSTNSYVSIAKRESDIVIELDNVVMTSVMGKSCIMPIDGSIDTTENRYTVMLKLTGSSSLTGADYTDLPETRADNAEQKGYKGGSGGNGILAPELVILGEGSVSFKGGNGGTGGTGSGTTTWATVGYGYGGDGGDGGNGIKATTVILAMELAGIVKAYGGNGGSGGKPGANGSIITGPLLTAIWDSCYGDEGSSGSALVGTMTKYGGSYIVD